MSRHQRDSHYCDFVRYSNPDATHSTTTTTTIVSSPTVQICARSLPPVSPLQTDSAIDLHLWLDLRPLEAVTENAAAPAVCRSSPVGLHTINKLEDRADQEEIV